MATTEEQILCRNIHSYQVFRLEGIDIPPGEARLVPKAFVEKYGSVGHLRFDFSPYRHELMAEDEQGNPVFDLFCPISMVDGYGRHALSIWKGLREMGVMARLRDGGWKVDRDYLPVGLLEEARAAARSLPAKVGVCMSVPYDPTFQQMQSVTRIAISQFETDRIPTKHVEVMNRCHHLITTSGFQPRVWRDSGLTVPIDVLVPGVDTDYFREVDRPPTSAGFRVLMLGALTGRKNPMGAIRIFQHASRGRPDWKLTIKTRRAADIEYVMEYLKIPIPDTDEEWWLDFQARSPADPRIMLVLNNSSPDGVRWLYETHECLLWPSKGEGCGLPPLEALSSGMEVVCADNSGMSDFLSKAWAYPIRTHHTEPADSWSLQQLYNLPDQGFGQEYIDAYGPVGSWWVPDELHASKLLEEAYQNWKKGKPKGPRAARYVRQHHTLRHQAESVWKVVQKYV